MHAIRTFSAVVAGFALIGVACAQPTDSCATAPETGVGTWAFDTSAATPEGFAFSGCVNGGSPPAASPGATTPDVWLKHTMVIDGNYLSVEACSSPAPALVAYLDASGCGSASLACNVRATGESFVCDSNTKTRSRVVVGPVPVGTTILIRVSSATTNGTTSGTLTITEMMPAINDARANALPISEASGAVAFDTKVATYDSNDFSTTGFCATAGQGATAPDVWFQYVPTTSGRASAVITDPSPGTAANFNSLVSVFAGTDLTALACARSNVGGTIGSSKAARVVFSVTAGQSYFIRAGGSVAGVGTLQIFAPQAVPANDDCAGAISLNGGGATPDGLVVIDTAAAGISAGTITGCSPGFSSVDASFDLWYEYTPPAGTPANSFVVFSTCGSAMTTKVVAVSSCSATTQLTPGCSTSVCLNETGSLSNAGWSRVGPVTAGTPILVRVAGVNGTTGQATLAARLEVPPSNDTCSATSMNNLLVEDVPSAYTTMAATQDRTSICSTSTLPPDVWFRYVPTQSGIATFRACSAAAREANLSTITAYSDCAAAEILSCRSVLADSCFPTPVSSAGARGVLRMRVTAGESLLVRVASASTDAALRFSRGTIEVTLAPLSASEYYEGNVDSAGQTLATATSFTGTTAVTSIRGNINGGTDRADMYKIQICDVGQFSATVANTDRIAQETLNFNLFLFDANGIGVDFQSPVGASATLGNSLVLGSGTYYLAISTPRTGTTAPLPVDSLNAAIWLQNPAIPAQAPNGPGANGAIANWNGTSTVASHTPYTILLTGVGGNCAADFNASCSVSVQDIFDFLAAWFAGDVRADVNHVGGVTVQDIFDFLAMWFAGC